MPQQLDHTNEHVVVLDDDIDLAAALEAIERAGGRVLHKLAGRTLIVASRKPVEQLSAALPGGAKIVVLTPREARTRSRASSSRPFASERLSVSAKRSGGGPRRHGLGRGGPG